MKFAWLNVGGGELCPINPRRVAYVVPAVKGSTLIFEAVTGGRHQLWVELGVADVVAALEKAANAAPDAAAPTIPTAPPVRARQGKRDKARVPAPRL